MTPTVQSNPSQKPNFSKSFFKPEEFETPAPRFHVKGKDFENGTLWFPDRFFLKNNPKVAGDCCVFIFNVKWCGETLDTSKFKRGNERLLFPHWLHVVFSVYTFANVVDYFTLSSCNVLVAFFIPTESEISLSGQKMIEKDT